MSTVWKIALAFFLLALVFIVVRGIRQARPARRIISDGLAAVAGIFLCLLDVAPAWGPVVIAGCVVGIVTMSIVGRRRGSSEIDRR